jgi:hypothetical protein
LETNENPAQSGLLFSVNRLITQLYVTVEPRNAHDFLYNRVPEALRHLVTAEFKPSKSANTALTAHWNILLGITPV